MTDTQLKEHVEKQTNILIDYLSGFDAKRNKTIKADTFIFLMKLFSTKMDEKDIAEVVNAVPHSNDGYINIIDFAKFITARVPKE
jgi:Ca2+-binding EF-hand superfamily protein